MSSGTSSIPALSTLKVLSEEDPAKLGKEVASLASETILREGKKVMKNL